MNQNTVSRSVAGAFFFFLILVTGGALFLSLAYGLECSFGGYKLSCDLVPRFVGIFLLIHWPFLLISLVMVIRPFASSTAFRIGVFVYALILGAAASAVFLVKDNNAPVVASLSGTEQACQLMAEYSVQRQYCYENLAQTTDNIAYCDQAQTINCYLYFAEKNKDPSLCPAADGYCIMTMAEKLADESLCKRIANGVLVSQCYASIAAKTNNDLLCAYSDQSFSYCNDAYRRMSENPGKYVTATKIDLTFELLQPSILSGQNAADLMKVTARNSDGVAILNGVELWAKNVSMSDTFYILHMYKGGLPISGGGAFSNPADRPSQAMVSGAPTIIFPGQTVTFTIQADVEPGPAKDVQFSSVGGFALGKTKINARLVGNTTVKILK